MMEYVYEGIRHGLAYGAIAWLGGWVFGKIFKLFRYVAR